MGERPGMNSSRDLALLVLFVGAAALPFLGQPFHMDDNFYMDMARNALVHPLYPNDTPYVFEGRHLPDMGSHSHPPMQTYFLALLQRLVGEAAGREPVYHLAALVFPLLAVSSFYFLAARTLHRPLWPALALAACPLFMVMQHNLMTDVPTMAFWLAAITAFVYAADRRGPFLFTASALFQFAAMFTSYQSFALTPLLVFRQLTRGGGRAAWTAIAAPPAAMGLWLGLNYLHYGRFIPLDTLGYVGSRHPGSIDALATKLTAAVVQQGWLVVFPLFILYLWGRAWRGRLVPCLVLAGAWLAQFLIPEYRLPEKAIFVAGLASGACVLCWMAQMAARSMRGEGTGRWFARPEGQFYGLWYFGVLFYCVVFLTEGSARYLLPLVPPVLLVLFRHLEMRETVEYRQARRPLLRAGTVASGIVVVSLGWGLALSHADLEFARLYPRAASEYARLTRGMAGYFAGEWGFRYYMRQEGAAQVPADESEVEAGGWIALPHLALPYELPAALASMIVPVDEVDLSPRTPLRLMDRESRAGFYSTAWGMIPFSWSSQPAERLHIGQVHFMVQGFPSARVDGTTQAEPWIGMAAVDGRSPLALLLMPGNRVRYDWAPPQPLLLELECALDPRAYAGGKGQVFRLRIAQHDAAGREIASWKRECLPEVRPEDRLWLPVRLPLQPSPPRGGWLEFSFDCEGVGCGGPAAFASPVLRPPAGVDESTYR